MPFLLYFHASQIDGGGGDGNADDGVRPPFIDAVIEKEERRLETWATFQQNEVVIKNTDRLSIVISIRYTAIKWHDRVF